MDFFCIAATDSIGLESGIAFDRPHLPPADGAVSAVQVQRTEEWRPMGSPAMYGSGLDRSADQRGSEPAGRAGTGWA